MRKIIVSFVCFMFLVPSFANAGFLSMFSSRKTAPRTKVEDSSEVKKDKNGNLIVDKPVNTKTRSDRDRVLEGTYSTKGSPSLLRMNSNNSNKGRSDFDRMLGKREKVSNSPAEIDARAAKYKEQYEQQRGIPLKEMEEYYSKSLGAEKPEKLEIVSDPLDFPPEHKK